MHSIRGLCWVVRPVGHNRQKLTFRAASIRTVLCQRGGEGQNMTAVHDADNDRLVRRAVDLFTFSGHSATNWMLDRVAVPGRGCEPLNVYSVEREID